MRLTSIRLGMITVPSSLRVQPLAASSARQRTKVRIRPSISNTPPIYSLAAAGPPTDGLPHQAWDRRLTEAPRPETDSGVALQFCFTHLVSQNRCTLCVTCVNGIGCVRLPIVKVSGSLMLVGHITPKNRRVRPGVGNGGCGRDGRGGRRA